MASICVGHRGSTEEEKRLGALRSVDMNRLLVVGAGASIEECRRSGNRRSDREYDFPSIRNLGRKLFQVLPTPFLTTNGGKIELRQGSNNPALLVGIVSYLQHNGVEFDKKVLNSFSDGRAISPGDLAVGPIERFLKLEEAVPEQHNVEKLFEYVWEIFGKNDELFWKKFVYDGVYFKLFFLFTEQFGLGPGVKLHAGKVVANQIQDGDVVINLNYDIAFDLAIKQSNRGICYSPDFSEFAINLLKPHGSFNLYYSTNSGNFFFENPDQLSGSLDIEHNGEVFSPSCGIIPPRLNKSYMGHPLASYILDVGRPFKPNILTFWGVGLTESDVDLLEIYREASTDASIIEFINPSQEPYMKAQQLLSRKLRYFSSLDDWAEAQK